MATDRLRTRPVPNIRETTTGADHPPWLADLLRAYALMDAAMAERVAASALRGRPSVCRRGCPTCCRQPVPLTAVEARGIEWYASLILSGPSRQALKRVLLARDVAARCPFLLDDACSIYPVRPLACREFVVRGAVCGPTEDPTATRPEDMIHPPRRAKRDAFRLLLPHLDGAAAEAERKDDIEALRRKTVIIQDLDWRPLYAAMAAYDHGQVFKRRDARPRDRGAPESAPEADAHEEPPG